MNNDQFLSLLPPSYVRYKNTNWEGLSSANKNKIVMKWNEQPTVLKERFLLDENIEEIDVTRKSNWNKHDWGRLIHLFHCPELKQYFIEYYQVISLLYIF
jgi:hypothetical protein